MALSHIVSVASVVPEFSIHQKEVDSLLTFHYQEILRPRSFEVMHQMLQHPSIEKRHFCVDSPSELLSLKNEDLDKRTQRFSTWSVRLATDAAKKAMAKVGINSDQVGAIFVHTCTGYMCPGIASHLVEALHLAPTVQATDCVGTGCSGALPLIQLGCQYLQLYPDKFVLCVAVEVCSATFQMADDMSLIVSNVLFGDGAAAVVLSTQKSGFTILDHLQITAAQYREDVRFISKNGQLFNQLSLQLPKIIRQQVPAAILELLSRNGLKTTDITHWALHPGGDKMIEGIGEELSLTAHQLFPTRHILQEYGNMSSPTVLFCMEYILNQTLTSNGMGILVAYGAGMSIHVTLVQAACP
ncbi:MAG: hypothetical protein JW795_11235 [Chitinivibrionales bacterium]|nr:hypothetical protein [Chitinivibrionales bacterium]